MSTRNDARARRRSRRVVLERERSSLSLQRLQLTGSVSGCDVAIAPACGAATVVQHARELPIAA